jgi:hypothetical protein
VAVRIVTHAWLVLLVMQLPMVRKEQFIPIKFFAKVAIKPGSSR